MHPEDAAWPLCPHSHAEAGCSSNGAAEVLASTHAEARLPGHARSCGETAGRDALLAAAPGVLEDEAGCIHHTGSSQ